MQKKTFVIGDIHGCYHTLMALIAKLPKDARLIFVGDLCDRGNYSKEVIEFISSNNYECVLGNHDYYMLRYIYDTLDGKRNMWNSYENMGHDTTLSSYANDRESLDKHILWISTLPQYIQIDEYFITHAFALPYYQRRDNHKFKEALMINRLNAPLRWKANWEKDWKQYPIINIFGHDDADEVQIGDNYYGIDTACVYGGKLTAIELGTMKLYQQKLLKRDINKSSNSFIKRFLSLSFPTTITKSF
ncbi:MAG: metallophosphoesterase [Sulfurovum sp.]